MTVVCRAVKSSRDSSDICNLRELALPLGHWSNAAMPAGRLL
jgi:hypothetical protein